MEGDGKEWRDNVGEGEDAGGADDADEAAEGGDPGADYVREGPVDGD